MIINSKNTGRLLTGLVAGALVGTSIGLLAAPKPGKESRHAVKEKAGEYVNSLKERRWKRQPVAADAD